MKVLKMSYVTKVAPISKEHSTKSSKAASTSVTTKIQESKGTVKLKSFQKAFGCGALHSQLWTLSVPDAHRFNLEKDKESLITLKTLMSSHFVWRYDKDYENLRSELRRVRLQWYIPGDVVVKKGFDIYNMICEFLPGRTAEGLRSRLCDFLNANLDYFGQRFQEEFVPKDINMFYYICKQIRQTTILDHNIWFLLKESIFTIGVRHN